MQSAPPVPHIALLVPARQPPLGPQQPFGHETPSHMQAPLTQCLSGPHAAEVPHRHAPLAAQVSAAIGSHPTQVPPADPHAAIDGVTHAPLAQHPSGQVDMLHTQVPFWHWVPAAHGAGLAPQAHAPVAGSQRSARMTSHGAHVVPPMPHVATAGTWQAPSLPQQPFGQDAVVHTQAPARQALPAPHCAPVPQRQSPALEQLSAIDGSQLTQAVPANPQLAVADAVHFEPEQQPPGQLAASQPVHTPPVHALPPPQS